MDIKKPQYETNIFIIYYDTYYLVHISFVIFNLQSLLLF